MAGGQCHSQRVSERTACSLHITGVVCWPVFFKFLLIIRSGASAWLFWAPRRCCKEGGTLVRPWKRCSIILPQMHV